MAGAVQPEAGPPLLPTPELTWDELESFLDSLQVRSDIAIRRHQALVNCAFSFCWAAWFADPP
jgi:hypothetical protein